MGVKAVRLEVASFQHREREQKRAWFPLFVNALNNCP